MRAISQLVDIDGLQSAIGIFPLSVIPAKDMIITTYFRKDANNEIVVGIEIADLGSWGQQFDSSVVRSPIERDDLENLRRLFSNEVLEVYIGERIKLKRVSDDEIQVSRQISYNEQDSWIGYTDVGIKDQAPTPLTISVWTLKRFIIDYLDIIFSYIKA